MKYSGAVRYIQPLKKRCGRVRVKQDINFADLNDQLVSDMNTDRCLSGDKEAILKCVFKHVLRKN